MADRNPGPEEKDEMTLPASSPPPSQWMRRVDAGEVLFREGDVDGQVFVLLDGRVEIRKDGAPLAEVGVSESFIGEVSALTGKPRWATATTVVPSMLLVVKDVGDLFRAEPAWAFRLARVLAERLDRTNEHLKRLQTSLEEARSRGGFDETSTVDLMTKDLFGNV